MNQCTSTYTVNRRTGERLTCTGPHLIGSPSRLLVHQASAYGLSWTWSSEEADADPELVQ